MSRLVALVLISLCSMSVYAGIIEGNAKGSVTITLIYDYQCPHCHVTYRNLEKVVGQDKDIKLVLLPVAILNNDSIAQAAYAYTATQYPDAFDEINVYLMYGNIKTKRDTEMFLRSLGVFDAQFVRASHSRKTLAAMADGVDTLKDLRENIVPIVIVKNKGEVPHVLLGEQTASEIKKAVHHVH